MKKTLFHLFLIMLIGCSTPQQPPSKKEKSDEVLLPNGWKIISQCSADFNNDKLTDYAYVIQEKKESVANEDGDCMDGQPFYRKELIIQFSQANKHLKINYRTSKIFGACNWGIQGVDAFNEIGARKNTLKISFTIGGTLRSHLSYYFRYQNDDWYLIGYEEAKYQVPSTDKYIEEINYLTGKRVMYEIVNGKQSQSEETNIGKSNLISELNVVEHSEPE